MKRPGYRLPRHIRRGAYEEPGEWRFWAAGVFGLCVLAKMAFDWIWNLMMK